MKHRSVVTNFLFRWSNPEQTQQQVALFHRSHHPNIRSYQGKYAPISGSIEPDDPNPLLAAKREIQEETQLDPSQDITLDFCGKPYSFEDEQAGRSWTVYPFGWKLNVTDDKIKIDWEHDGWAWFDPQEILDGSRDDECVPKLANSLQRVFFGPNGIFRGGGYLVGRDNTAGKRFLETINQLKQDSNRESTAAGLTALKGLHSIAERFRGSSTEGEKSSSYWHVLSVAAYHFIHSTQPSEISETGPPVLIALEEVAETLENGALDPAVACTILETHITQRQTPGVNGGNNSDRSNILRTNTDELEKVEGKLFGNLYD